MPHFPGANLLGTTVKDNLRWAQFDHSTQLVTALQDSLGRWVVTPEERTVQRATETGIHMSATVPDQTARAGTPVHAWRMLGLVDSDGSPTRRGVIFSYFQHGEGLASQPRWKTNPILWTNWPFTWPTSDLTVAWR
ncbi:hypothetical protein [Verrucomicrobium spinosum]|uniref:hypothetical protein n=1 Tax=Verrucomicrobium spinosum TaxID=2736 RepID=UPI00094658BA|nr:hypothetical protein [Verrucomicrobium spinosum]